MLSSSDRATVAKLLGLVGSHHDGEALAAARKAHKLLAARGTTWADLLGIEKLPPEAPHIALARDLLHQGKHHLTDWESRFLRGILAFKNLSPQQRQSLDAIAEKIAAILENHPPTE